MSVQKITLLLPKVGEAPEGKPSYCPRCGSPYLARHTTLRRFIKDVTTVSVQVYRCSYCGAIFRHSPAGITRKSVSQRPVALATLLRAVGFSSIRTAKIAESMGGISQATAWRFSKTVVKITGERQRVRARLLEPGELPEPDEHIICYRFLEDEEKHKIGVELWRSPPEEIPKAVGESLEQAGAQLKVETLDST